MMVLVFRPPYVITRETTVARKDTTMLRSSVLTPVALARQESFSRRNVPQHKDHVLDVVPGSLMINMVSQHAPHVQPERTILSTAADQLKHASNAQLGHAMLSLVSQLSQHAPHVSPGRTILPAVSHHVPHVHLVPSILPPVSQHALHV